MPECYRKQRIELGKIWSDAGILLKIKDLASKAGILQIPKAVNADTVRLLCRFLAKMDLEFAAMALLRRRWLRLFVWNE